MYKGKGSYGSESTGGLRAKKTPKDLRNTSGAHSHDHSRIDSSQGKNQLSKYKVKINGKLLDYISLLETEIDSTKKRIKQEEQTFMHVVLNVSNFLGVEGMTKEAITSYIEGLNVGEEEAANNPKKGKNLEWFDTMQQNRFKSFLYGSAPEKRQTKSVYSTHEPVEEKRKYRKTTQYSTEPKRRKKVQSKRPARSQRKEKDLSSRFPVQDMIIEEQPHDDSYVPENLKPESVDSIKMMVQEEDNINIEMDADRETGKYNYDNLGMKRLDQNSDLVSKEG